MSVITNWKIDDVANWLTDIGLGDYQQTFRGKHVNNWNLFSFFQVP